MTKKKQPRLPKVIRVGTRKPAKQRRPKFFLEELRALVRVLRLVDGYLGALNQQLLLGWDGGLMTVQELRQHVIAAKRLCYRKGIRP